MTEKTRIGVREGWTIGLPSGRTFLSLKQYSSLTLSSDVVTQIDEGSSSALALKRQALKDSDNVGATASFAGL